MVWLQAEHGRLPAPYSKADADKLLALAKKLAAAAKAPVELDEDIVRKLAWTAAGDLSPMAAIFGGIVGQEAVKALTGKFHPIEQFLYFDAVEALPSEPLSEQDAAPQVQIRAGHACCSTNTCFTSMPCRSSAFACLYERWCEGPGCLTHCCDRLHLNAVHVCTSSLALSCVSAAAC